MLICDIGISNTRKCKGSKESDVGRFTNKDKIITRCLYFFNKCNKIINKKKYNVWIYFFLFKLKKCLSRECKRKWMINVVNVLFVNIKKTIICFYREKGIKVGEVVVMR